MTGPSPTRRQSVVNAAASGLLLSVHALRLTLAAQALRRGGTLRQVSQRMKSMRWLPRGVDVDAASRVTRRCCSRMAEFFGLFDSCLVRSLVLASLLSDARGVEVHLGFRENEGEENPLDGHAWVTLEKRVVPAGSDVHDGDGDYRQALSIPFSRVV